MNLTLFSPVSQRSAIARASALVVRALGARGHQVTIVRTEDSRYVDSPTHAFDVELVRWDDAARVEREIRSCDAVIHQVGNSYEFHRGSLEWLPESAGVVCLHDYFLGHLFWGWAEGRRARAAAVLRTWYRPEVADRYFSFQSPAEFIEGTHQAAPMVEWVASMADAILTHSSWGLDRVLTACGGPVDVVPLPYDAPGAAGAPLESSRAGGPFTIVTVGHINPNKCVERVIQAIAASPVLRSRCEYRLIGRIEPATHRELSALASGLDVRLVIGGEVNDRSLELAVRQADLVCCLRLPALEAASASAIESMLYGKPIVVMDVGFFRELPDDCVRKVSPGSGLAGIRRELEHLLQHGDERRAMGARAAAWASATFSPDRYADALAAICERASSCAPAMSAVRAFTEALVGWGASEQERANRHTLDPLRILEGS